MSTGFFAGFPGVSGRRDAPRYPPLSRGVDARLLFVVDDVLKWLVKARAAERVGCAAGSVCAGCSKSLASREPPYEELLAFWRQAQVRVGSTVPMAIGGRRRPYWARRKARERDEDERRRLNDESARSSSGDSAALAVAVSIIAVETTIEPTSSSSTDSSSSSFDGGGGGGGSSGGGDTGGW